MNLQTSTKNSPFSSPIINGSTVLLSLNHYIQATTWDCGITCIMMILSEDKADNLRHNLFNICPEECQNQSTWTIDLCYVLHYFSVKVKYFTKTIGVNPEFTSEKFYNNFISKDEARVNKRFKTAASVGIQIETGFLEMDQLLNHLQQSCPAIVLIDANLLNCPTCSPSFVSNIGSLVRNMLNFKFSFTGHYIVVCGFNPEEKILYYKDPAVRNDLCTITYDCFEKARQAHGTDNDVILIYR